MEPIANAKQRAFLFLVVAPEGLVNPLSLEFPERSPFLLQSSLLEVLQIPKNNATGGSTISNYPLGSVTLGGVGLVGEPFPPSPEVPSRQPRSVRMVLDEN